MTMLEEKCNAKATVSASLTILDRGDGDVEKLAGTDGFQTTSSSNSTVVASDDSSSSSFRTWARGFRGKRISSGTLPYPRPSIFSRLKGYLRFNSRAEGRTISINNWYERCRVRISRVNNGYTLLILLMTFVNILHAVWQYYYMQANLRPYDFTTLVNNSHGWGSFVAFLFIVGCILIYPNGFAAIFMHVPFKTALPEKVHKWGTAQKQMHITRVARRLLSWFLLGTGALLWLALGLLITFGPFVGPFVTVPVGWKFKFRDSCQDFGVRVWLDSKISSPATSVEFRQFEPQNVYRMQFRPNPQESNDFYNVFSLDPGYLPGAASFVPNYDSVHYNFTDLTYSTKLGNNTIHSGGFELHPRLRLPDLHLEADIQGFARSASYEPFLKVYSTASNEAILDEKRAWSDNTNVMLRTAQFSVNDKLQVCARSRADELEGLGDMTPVPVGLLILVRAGREIPIVSS